MRAKGARQGVIVAESDDTVVVEGNRYFASERSGTSFSAPA